MTASFFNPAWRQNLHMVMVLFEGLVKRFFILWCIGMLLGVWGNVCCSFWSLFRKADGGRVFSFSGFVGWWCGVCELYSGRV